VTSAVLLKLVSAALIGSVVLAGCYSLSEPKYKPGDQRDIYNSIARRNLVVGEPLAGKTACADPEMIANTMYLTAHLPGETEPRDVYIHVYRVKTWDESKVEVDRCQAVYAEANPGSEITRIDVPTYRIFGADWSDELADELKAAFDEAAQAG